VTYKFERLSLEKVNADVFGRNFHNNRFIKIKKNERTLSSFPPIKVNCEPNDYVYETVKE